MLTAAELMPALADRVEPTPRPDAQRSLSRADNLASGNWAPVRPDGELSAVGP